jgi:hypothetical protein
LFGRKFHPDTLDKLLDLFSNYTRSVTWNLWLKSDFSSYTQYSLTNVRLPHPHESISPLKL